MSELKTIDYRGGLVRFRIPAEWTEEYEPEGGGTFYRDAPDSGTLRLNVLTFSGPARPDKAALMRAIEKSGTPEWLASGNAMVGYTAGAVEDGEALTLFHWEVANSVAPTHLRLAMFSYTVSAKQAASPEVAAEVELLTYQIRAIEFAEEMGVTAE